jgi:uncharacterized membrane protein
MITFLLPAAALLTWGLLSWLWRRDPVRERSAGLEATFRALVFRIVLLIVGLHVVVLASLVSGRNLVPRAVPLLMGLGVVAIGDLLPRLRPNIAIGFRAPWTLRNHSVWMRTHRFAGYAAVSLGAVIIVAGVALPRPTADIAVLAAGVGCASTLVWYSRRIYRSAESSVVRRTGDNGAG